MSLEEAIAELDAIVPTLESADLRIVHRCDRVVEHRGPRLHLCSAVEFDNVEVTSDGIRALHDVTALYAEAGLWCFERWHYCPGPGPDDFVIKSLLLLPLLPRILDYYGKQARLTK